MTGFFIPSLLSFANLLKLEFFLYVPIILPENLKGLKLII